MSAALIVGASGGIGHAVVAELLAGNAHDVVVAACREPGASDAMKTLANAHPQRLLTLALDVTDPVSLGEAAARLERRVDNLTMLMNCAGVLHDGALQPERRLSEVDAAALLEAFRVNALGALLVAQAFAPLFDREARTVLANLSARVGSIGDNRLGGWYAYRASKAAQNMFTRNLAIELSRRHRGLICVALHPGTVDTGLSRPFQARVPPERLFTPARAARQLLGVIDALGPDDNGGFFAWDGSPVPW